MAAAVPGGSGTGGERWSLAGATALVTGGSKGIGHAVVEELAAFGARVHTCSRSAADLEECRRRWAEKGLAAVTTSVCDVAVRADREQLMDTVKETFDGKLDILVRAIVVNTEHHLNNALFNTNIISWTAPRTVHR
jgi:Tropinone reductase 1